MAVATPLKSGKEIVRDRWRLLCARKDVAGVELVRGVREARLTYLDAAALLDLREAVQRAEAAGIAGDVLEARCALGGSAIVLAASKARDRQMTVHDVFGQIPPPSDDDGADVLDRYAVIESGGATGIDGDSYYGYETDLLDRVEASFERFGLPLADNHVRLVPGLFEDTIRPSSVAVAHVDGDWYDSVKVCLDRIWPVLSPGGVIVIDDYDHWSGCRRAVDEFVPTQPDCVPERHARLHLRRRT